MPGLDKLFRSFVALGLWAAAFFKVVAQMQGAAAWSRTWFGSHTYAMFVVVTLEAAIGVSILMERAATGALWIALIALLAGAVFGAYQILANTMHTQCGCTGAIELRPELRVLLLTGLGLLCVASLRLRAPAGM